VTDGIFLMVGMVIGVGIFKRALDRGGKHLERQEILLRPAAGRCRLPLRRARLRGASRRAIRTPRRVRVPFARDGTRRRFLFAWSRLTVIQTGAIAAIAFVFGDLRLRDLFVRNYSSAICALPSWRCLPC